jgi:regulator of cell morphogenesis and NO signaling
MRDPIDHLLEEHRVIMADFEALRRAVEDLRRRGDTALPDALPALRRVGDMMATTLHRHARKEDEALFPALEKVFGTGGGPTMVMRQEHRDIHAGAELFRRTLHELNEVEHPAIVAGGEALRDLSAAGGSADQLRRTGEEIVNLVDLHFGKEENILFPMAREVLTPEALEAVGRRIEEIMAESVSG